MPFQYFDPASVQFGVCRGEVRPGDSVVVPVDDGVSAILQEMVSNTRNAFAELELERYEPSQEYSAASRALLPLGNPLGSKLRTFFDHENWQIDARALADPREVTAYFCVIHDQENNKLIAIRRASQFKAVLRAHLIQVIDDSLRAVEDNIFKLDTDFDVLIVDRRIYINRVAAFEHLAGIEGQIQAAALESVGELGAALPTFGFDGIETYVSSHKRAARIVAALRARDDLGSTSVTNFRRECARSGVAVKTVDGKLCPEEGHEMEFLQMLDRRRYALSLISGTWEQYEASSRKSVGVRERNAEEPVRGRRVARARG